MRPKIKKMTLDELEDNFQMVDKQEQVLYVGRGRTWFLNQHGVFNYAGYCPSGNDTIFSPCGMHSMSLQMGVVENIKSSSYLPPGWAKDVFAFVAQYTNVEWGLTMEKDGGRARLFTNHEYDAVKKIGNANTAWWVHSHPFCQGPYLSDRDRENANRFGGYHVLFYNGQFINFNYDGFYGDWRPTLW